MRSMAKCVLPVLVGPRTALIALLCTCPRWQCAGLRATVRRAGSSIHRNPDSHGRKLSPSLLCFGRQSGHRLFKRDWVAPNTHRAINTEGQACIRPIRTVTKRICSRRRVGEMARPQRLRTTRFCLTCLFPNFRGPPCANAFRVASPDWTWHPTLAVKSAANAGSAA